MAPPLIRNLARPFIHHVAPPPVHVAPPPVHVAPAPFSVATPAVQVEPAAPRAALPLRRFNGPLPTQAKLHLTPPGVLSNTRAVTRVDVAEGADAQQGSDHRRSKFYHSG